MTWNSFHRRGEILRTVIDLADARRDGTLPMDVEGVTETFGDEVTLLGALQLRWHTRLAGCVEKQLADEPLDLENAVVLAWLATAEGMPGVRRILDRHIEAPTTREMARALARASVKEHEMLAMMAGRASAPGDAAARVGRSIETSARASYTPRPATHRAPRPRSLVQRLRAQLVA